VPYDTLNNSSVSENDLIRRYHLLISAETILCGAVCEIWNGSSEGFIYQLLCFHFIVVIWSDATSMVANYELWPKMLWLDQYQECLSFVSHFDRNLLILYTMVLQSRFVQLHFRYFIIIFYCSFVWFFEVIDCVVLVKPVKIKHIWNYRLNRFILWCKFLGCGTEVSVFLIHFHLSLVFFERNTDPKNNLICRYNLLLLVEIIQCGAVCEV